MRLSRRDVLAGVGGVGIAYAFHVGCAEEPEVVELSAEPREPPVRSPDDPGIDYRQWLVVEVTESSSVVTRSRRFKTIQDLLSGR